MVTISNLEPRNCNLQVLAFSKAPVSSKKSRLLVYWFRYAKEMKESITRMWDSQSSSSQRESFLHSSELFFFFLLFLDENAKRHVVIFFHEIVTFFLLPNFFDMFEPVICKTEIPGKKIIFKARGFRNLSRYGWADQRLENQENTICWLKSFSRFI